MIEHFTQTFNHANDMGIRGPLGFIVAGILTLFTLMPIDSMTNQEMDITLAIILKIIQIISGCIGSIVSIITLWFVVIKPRIKKHQENKLKNSEAK